MSSGTETQSYGVSEQPRCICHGQSCRRTGVGCRWKPGQSPAVGTGGVGRGAALCPARGFPTQRRARVLTSPHQWSALQEDHSQSPQDEAGTGGDPLGGTGCLLSPILPSYHPLCPASVPHSSHPGSPHSSCKPTPAPRWQYGRCGAQHCCKSRLTLGSNSGHSTKGAFKMSGCHLSLT